VARRGTFARTHAELQTTSPSNADPALPEIDPRDLAALLATADAPLLIDVREPHEHAYARIAGARLIPLATLSSAVAELPRDSDIVVYCHHGVRSAHAVAFLRSAGIAARNLAGGIDRWSVEVDPSVRRY
jgi:sulfur-carrier protein adenylyltransferase/sulfurtransferase